jgi:hypothetical protein
MQKPPQLPDGWHLIAPIDAAPGDGVLLPDGSIQILGVQRFDPIPIEVRRVSWAVRRKVDLVSEPASEAVCIETGCAQVADSERPVQGDVVELVCHDHEQTT